MEIDYSAIDAAAGEVLAEAQETESDGMAAAAIMAMVLRDMVTDGELAGHLVADFWRRVMELSMERIG